MHFDEGRHVTTCVRVYALKRACVRVRKAVVEMDFKAGHAGSVSLTLEVFVAAVFKFFPVTLGPLCACCVCSGFVRTRFMCIQTTDTIALQSQRSQFYVGRAVPRQCAMEGWTRLCSSCCSGHGYDSLAVTQIFFHAGESCAKILHDGGLDKVRVLVHSGHRRNSPAVSEFMDGKIHFAMDMSDSYEESAYHLRRGAVDFAVPLVTNIEQVDLNSTHTHTISRKCMPHFQVQFAVLRT